MYIYLSLPRMLQIAEIIRHTDFNYTTLVNDIALLKTGKYFAVFRSAHLKKVIARC